MKERRRLPRFAPGPDREGAFLFLPPLVGGRRLKLRYVTEAKARPPTFVVFGTRAEQTPEDYTRYLVNSLRDTFKLPGTPIRLQLRGTKNPFVDEE